MKSFIFSSLSFFALLFVSGCDNSQENNKPVPEGLKSFVIKGTLKNHNGNYIVLNGLNMEEQKWSKIDSLKPDADGNYELKVENAVPDFYVLKLNDTISQTVVADNGEIDFSADMKDFEKTKKFGHTKANIALENFGKDIESHTDTLRAISKRVNGLMQKGQFDSIAVYQEKFENEKKSIKVKAKEFINKQIPSVVVFAMIDQFNFDQDYAFLDSLRIRMEKEMPTSKYTKLLSSQFEKMNASKQQQQQPNQGQAVAVGTMAPDFGLQTPDGKTVNLSDYKGKIVLVDFWASWCKPCRAENPNVVKMYNKFKGKNFDILGVSLDQDKNAWMAAIEKDQLTWKHISDLQGWDSPVAGLYGVQGIPATFLIDATGKVIDVNLRGAALESKLEELLK